MFFHSGDSEITIALTLCKQWSQNNKILRKANASGKVL